MTLSDLAELAQMRREAVVGGAGSEAYVALFCPHCGEHINEVDEQDTAEEQVPDMGSLYRCGWCGVETRDWNHVVVCRRTHKARAALLEKQRDAEDAAMFRRSRNRLRRMLDELGE